MRKYAREVCLDLVFEYLFNGVEQTELDSELFDTEKLTEEDRRYLFGVYHGVVERKDALKCVIAEFARGYTPDRIYKVDFAILLVSVYELLHTDTPAPVVINEAADLAKKFSAEKSVAFVNGILASVYKNKMGANV